MSKKIDHSKKCIANSIDLWQVIVDMMQINADYLSHTFHMISTKLISWQHRHGQQIFGNT